jgi:2-methylcitrate dehydratase
VNSGLISCTATVAKYLGLPSNEIREAINIAVNGHLALGQTRSGELSEWKALAYGNATRNAFHAVDLARSGIHGPSTIFEGESGLSRQLKHPLNIDISEFGGQDGDFLIKSRI